ncbi:hypothetical protein [Aliivibrio sp. SR45-2]|uniref:hypothetical protein n=1 Tax=Aliivibrio sp. SR45-2 TaxID=2760931 RepID=UPI0015FBF33E|nr:hypothetical protein [Aliivibrio sp. SR45-2]MBB1314937.1 hypothetical protein [Aliivibrio sp. SR45-2]
MKIRTASGFYLPSCFFMQIDSDDDVINAINNNSQTFAHEYIHFLQDIIFPYSIRYTMMENLKFGQIDFSSNSLERLERPFDTWDADTNVVIRQFDYTWGCSRFEDTAPKIDDIQFKHFTTYTGARVFKYQLCLADGSLYQVGARDFMEYIAHKVESRFWRTSAPDMPYKVPDILFEHLGYGHLSNEIKVCIIEYCMFNDNPMHRFYQLMTEDFHNNSNELDDYEGCVKYLLNLDWVAVGTGYDSVFTKSQRRLIALKDSLKSKYHSDFASISSWIDLVVDYSNSNFSEKFIFSQMILMSQAEFTVFIKTCISDIGIPLVFNEKQSFVSLLPKEFDKDEFLQLYYSFQFMNYVSYGYQQCPQGQYCVNNCPSSLNERCVNSPMSNYLNTEECPINTLVLKYQ